MQAPNPPFPAGAHPYLVTEVLDGVEYMGYYLVVGNNDGFRGVAEHYEMLPGSPAVRLLGNPPYYRSYAIQHWGNTFRFLNILHFLQGEELVTYYQNPANTATINALNDAERAVIQQKLGAYAAQRRMAAGAAYVRAVGGFRRSRTNYRKSVRKNKKRQSRKYK